MVMVMVMVMVMGETHSDVSVALVDLSSRNRRFDFRNLILLFALRRLDWGELVAEVEKIRAAKVSSPAFACASRLAYDRGAWS
ncbi:MAG: hypothetical protein H6729_13635 [Deltaproteobacteria bacterium]|nr:hypothetical protein [Deltaproteobacteria bacterium]